MEAGEGIRYSSVAVLHVHYGKVVPGEPRYLGDCGGEGEEEDAIEGLAVLEAGFERLWGRSGGDGGGVWQGRR